MSKVIVEHLSAHIAKLVLNDPERLNAMSLDMARDFDTAIEKLKHRSLRAIILTGAGKAFSAGGDLKMLEEKQRKSSDENKQEMMLYYYDFLGLLQLDVPVIAALNGSAIGAGLCVACACDIRLAAVDAKLGLTFVKLGLHPGMGITYTLPKIVGHGRARELLLTGRVVEAKEALRLGLVNEVVPGADLISRAQEIAEEIAQNGPLSVRQLTATMRESPDALEQALLREAKCQAENYASEEFSEGLAAVIGKRKASF